MGQPVPAAPRSCDASPSLDFARAPERTRRVRSCARAPRMPTGGARGPRSRPSRASEAASDPLPPTDQCVLQLIERLAGLVVVGRPGLVVRAVVLRDAAVARDLVLLLRLWAVDLSAAATL